MFIASFTGTARAQSTVLAISPSNYTYYGNYTTPPATLIFNITLTNVTNLSAWQVGIQWNPAILVFKNMSIPTNNIFTGQSILTAGPDNTNPAIVVYSAALAPGGAPFTGSGIVAQLELNLTQAALVPPASSTIAFEGIGIDTFLLDNNGGDISSTQTNSMYANTYLTGNIVTHTIAGSSKPVTTASNGTILPNSTVINTASKTISFNVTGNTGDTAFVYAILPKDVINVTAFSNWNVTINGVKQPSPQITENATHTFVFATFPFASQVTLGVQGNWIIPELSSMLIILIIASSATIAIAKSRTRKK
jgi:hypothetical protein